MAKTDGGDGGRRVVHADDRVELLREQQRAAAKGVVAAEVVGSPPAAEAAGVFGVGGDLGAETASPSPPLVEPDPSLSLPLLRESGTDEPPKIQLSPAQARTAP